MNGTAGVPLLPRVVVARVDEDEAHLPRLERRVHVSRVRLKGEAAGEVGGSVGRGHVRDHATTLGLAGAASPLGPGAMWVIGDTVALSHAVSLEGPLRVGG